MKIARRKYNPLCSQKKKIVKLQDKSTELLYAAIVNALDYRKVLYTAFLLNHLCELGLN